MTIILEKKAVTEGEAFYNDRLPNALRKAQEYAGKQGYVASLPELVKARISASPEQEIWTNWYTANSEEDIGTTKQGKPILFVVHGNGILSSPERIERAYQDGLINRATQLSQKEILDLEEGKLPNGNVIPVYLLSEFKQGIKDLPRNYAVVMDFDEAKRTKSGYQEIDRLYDNPLFIVRSGGVEEAREYLDNVKKKLKVNKYGQRHPFNDVDINQTQGRLLFLSNDYDNGYLYDFGRFVGVRALENAVKPIAERVPKPETTLESRIREALEKDEPLEFDGRLYNLNKIKRE